MKKVNSKACNPFSLLLVFLFCGGLSMPIAAASGKIWSQLDLQDVFSPGRCMELAQAAASGKLEKVESLIKVGVSVDCTGLNGMTPLAWAWLNENRKGYQALLRHGASPNAGMGANKDPLLFKIVYSDIFYLKEALKYGADPNVTNEKTGNSVIFNCLDIDSYGHLKLLLDSGANPNHLPVGGEFTAIWLSINRLGRNFKNATELLNHGADPFLVPERWNGARGSMRENLIYTGKTLDPRSEEYRQRKIFIALLKQKYPNKLNEIPD